MWLLVGLLAALGLVGLMYRPTGSSVTATLPDLGDPALNSWILSWETHALVDEPTNFFEGNIFYPDTEAIKYSEIMLPIVPLFGITAALSGNPVLAYNVATLGLALFCLGTTYFLAKRMVGGLCAVVAALSFSFSGYVFMHQGHVQLLTLGFFPLAFLTLFRALDRRRLRDGVWLGVASALLTLGSFYYGAIWFLCLFVLVGVDLIRSRQPDRGWWYTLTTALAVIAVTVGPIAAVYAEFNSRVPFDREVGGLGLNAIDFLTPAPGSFLYEGLLNWAVARQPAGIGEHGFFVGFVVMALALLGFVLLVSRRHPRPGQGSPDRALYELRLLATAGVVSLIVAFGPEAKGVPMPFRLLAEYVPGFDGIRAASRLAVPALLAAAVLAAWGLNRLTSSISPAYRILTVAVVSAAILAEMWVAPIRVDVPGTEPIRAVLASSPPGAVVELPMREVADTAFAYTEGPRLLASIGDWRPRFNGYSGGSPPGYFADISVISQFPEPEALRLLTNLDLRYVVLHGAENQAHGSYSFAQVDEILDSLPVTARATRFGSDWLVDLRPDG
jgi:hypothetical protein